MHGKICTGFFPKNVHPKNVCTGNVPKMSARNILCGKFWGFWGACAPSSHAPQAEFLFSGAKQFQPGKTFARKQFIWEIVDKHKPPPKHLYRNNFTAPKFPPKQLYKNKFVFTIPCFEPAATSLLANDSEESLNCVAPHAKIVQNNLLQTHGNNNCARKEGPNRHMACKGDSNRLRSEEGPNRHMACKGDSNRLRSDRISEPAGAYIQDKN